MVDQECGTDRQIARLDPYRRLHMPIGTYTVPLECLADHRIFLSMPDQAYFFRIPVIDAEQAGLRVEHDSLAGEETAQVAAQGEVFASDGGAIA